MGADTVPPSSASAPLTSLSVFTSSTQANATATLAVGNDAISIGTVFGRALSGMMVSLSGTYTGVRVVFEAATHDNVSVWRIWPAWHMQQGVQIQYDNPVNNSAVAYWMPANGADNLRMRLTNISTGSVAAGAIAMHAPASIGAAPLGKLDWNLTVPDPGNSPIFGANIGNNVNIMVNHVTTAMTGLNARTTTLGSSYTVPLGKRLRIHSYAGNFIAGAAGGKCVVGLRSNLAGATVVGSDLLGQWTFGPSAGGTNPDERWSGVASALTEPIDIYNNGGGASVGLSAQGSAGTTGKLTFSLFGYLVGT